MMKAKNTFLFVLSCVSLTLLGVQCEDWLPIDRRYRLFVENKSQHSLKYYVALGSFDGPVYPDTTLPASNGYLHAEATPGEIEMLVDSGVKWEETFEHDLPSDTLSVFLFHADTLQKYGWDKVRSDYKVLKRYDLSLDDLNKIGFIIKYP